MNNPYITTYFSTTVRLHPSELDNNILKYIKSNIEKNNTNKCFGEYGYIEKIHEIELLNNVVNGKIIAQDPMCSPTFHVRFLATLCRPLKNAIITAKIVNMYEQLIFLSYGPLDIIVKTINGINKDLFTFNSSVSRWAYKKTDDKNVQKLMILKNDSYLKVKILSKRIIDKTKQITCIGFIEDIATDKDIEKSIKDSYEPKKYDNIDEYIDIEKKIQEAIESNLTSDIDTDILSDNDM